MKVIINKDRIAKLMAKFPHLKDNDLKLIATVWHNQAREKFGGEFAADLMTFFEGFIAGEFSHPESIRRTRAALQEKNPELRGKKWDERHGKEEAEAKEDINRFKNTL